MLLSFFGYTYNPFFFSLELKYLDDGARPALKILHSTKVAPINAIEFLKCLNEPHSYHIHGHESEGMHAD